MVGVMTARGGQKKPKLDSELAKLIFPLNMLMQDSSKNFSFLGGVDDLPLDPYIIQRKF